MRKVEAENVTPSTSYTGDHFQELLTIQLGVGLRLSHSTTRPNWFLVAVCFLVGRVLINMIYDLTLVCSTFHILSAGSVHLIIARIRDKGVIAGKYDGVQRLQYGSSGIHINMHSELTTEPVKTSR